jgi:pilus assembly protein CpaB
VSAAARRRRGLLLLSLALACGGIAAAQVGSRVRAVEARTGAEVPVVVAARDVPAGRKLNRADLALREVPGRYVPPDAIGTPGDAIGARSAAPLSRGAYVTAGSLAQPADGTGAGGALRRGERALEVPVAGGAALTDSGGPGARVDVVISTESRSGGGRTFLALENVELLALGGAGATPERSTDASGGGAASAATATATLRVTLRQAVYLTAAQNFAREVRLLPRPAGDRGRVGRSAVAADGL